MNFTIKPNFKVCGAMFGPRMKSYQELLLNLNEEDEESLLQEETITVDFEGARLDITPDMVDVRIESKEGFDVGMQNNRFVILNTELTDDLILEGLAREFVSKVQNIRKTSGLDIADRIKLFYSGDELTNKAFDVYSDYIMSETLATVYELRDGGEVNDINGHDVAITVEKN